MSFLDPGSTISQYDVVQTCEVARPHKWISGARIPDDANELRVNFLGHPSAAHDKAMNSNMFLTPDEIVELTEKKQRAAQRIVLNAIGIAHKVRPDGSLIVARAHVERELSIDTVNRAKKKTMPNWGAMRDA